MKIFKTIIAAMLLSLPAALNATVTEAPASVQDNVTEPTHFILCLKDGEQITFMLEHNPKVVNGEGMITVIDKDITIEYPWESLHKYMMGNDVETGIFDNVIAKDGTVGEILHKSGNIVLSGFKAAVPVSVTDINGITAYSSKTNADGYLMISMSEYPTGMYIVKAGNKTFKFIKR